MYLTLQFLCARVVCYKSLDALVACPDLPACLARGAGEFRTPGSGPISPPRAVTNGPRTRTRASFLREAPLCPRSGSGHLATAALSGASRHPTADSSCPLCGVGLLRPRLRWLWLERPARADGERRLAQPGDWLVPALPFPVCRARAPRASLLPCRLFVCLAHARGPHPAPLWLPPSRHGAEVCASAGAVACHSVGPGPPPSGRRHLRIAATPGCCPAAATTRPSRRERVGCGVSGEPIACPGTLLHRRTPFAALVAAVQLRAARVRVCRPSRPLLPRTAPGIAARTPPRLRVG